MIVRGKVYIEFLECWLADVVFIPSSTTKAAFHKTLPDKAFHQTLPRQVEGSAAQTKNLT